MTQHNGNELALYVYVAGRFQVFAGAKAIAALLVIRRLNFRRAADGVYVPRGTMYRPQLQPAPGVARI